MLDLKKFGLYMSELRENSGFRSQRQLAMASKISNGTIARIEAGTQKPQPETLYVLSKYLKVSYEELMKNAGYIESIDLSVHEEKRGYQTPKYDYQKDDSIPDHIKIILDKLSNLSEENQKDLIKTIMLLAEGYKNIENK